MQSHKNVRWTFFAGKHQLLLASDEPTGDKSERYSSLTAAELVIAKKKKLADSVANAPQVFSAVYKPLHKKKVTSRCPLYADQRNADSEADTTGFWNVVYK